MDSVCRGNGRIMDGTKLGTCNAGICNDLLGGSLMDFMLAENRSGHNNLAWHLRQLQDGMVSLADDARGYFGYHLTGYRRHGCQQYYWMVMRMTRGVQWRQMLPEDGHAYEDANSRGGLAS